MSAGAVLALHYTAVSTSVGCPIVVTEGPSQTGKSTYALALLGKVMLATTMEEAIKDTCSITNTSCSPNFDAQIYSKSCLCRNFLY